MKRHPSKPSARRARRGFRTRSRTGFTFAEVLFAVILLGIGFIMLAGMFPVAISQSQTNISETQAASMAQAAARIIQQNASDTNMPDTGGRFQRLYVLKTSTGSDDNNLTNDLWHYVKHSSISDTDPRYAWTAVYRRNGNDKFAQIIVFVAQSRDYDRYADGDLYGYQSERRPIPYTGTPFPATFEPKLVDVALRFGGANNDPDLCYVYNHAASDPAMPYYSDEFCNNAADNHVTEGCYIVIASDRNNPSTVGSIYRLGRALDNDPNPYPAGIPNPTGTGGTPLRFELVPGNDMTDALDNIPPTASGASTFAAQAYVIGRGYQERPTPGGAQPLISAGKAQDVAVYATFVQIRGG